MIRPALAAAISIAMAITATPLPAQAAPRDADLDRLLLAAIVDITDTATLRVNLDRYGKALGSRRGATVIVYLVDALRDLPPDGKPTLEEAQITELLDRISYHRRRGHPERMLPPLRVLAELLPGDARVLYALGEAYGVQSPAFDARKAEAAFAELNDVLLTKPSKPKMPRAKARALVAFLPEVGGDGDRNAWLRDRIRGFRESLRDGQPIGLWKLRDPRLEELQEDLRIVLRRGFQREIGTVLGLMHDIHPDDPATTHMLAQMHASMGPLFDPKRSIALYEEFLDLTSEQRFERRPDDDPIMSRDDVARRLASLEVTAGKDQLQELRIAAKEMLLTLTPIKGKPDPLLFFPDRTYVTREMRTVKRKLDKEEKILNRSTARLTKLKADLEGAKADYDRYKQGNYRRRGVRDPQPFLDAITSRKKNIVKLEKDLAPQNAKVTEIRQWYEACEARLARYSK